MSRPNSVLPHGRFPASKARGIDVAGSDAFSAPARLTESSFLTRSFLIRYVEEHVSLNDAAAFRVELDVPLEARSSSSSSAGGGATGAPVTLVLELMWCDLEEGPDGEPSGLKGDFAAVAKKEFRLNGIAKGIHAYSPLIYDDAHFCSTGLMVHSVLSDIRFRSTARGGAGNGTGTAGASASTGSGAGSAAGGGGGGGGGATGGGSGGGGGSGSSGSGGGGRTAPANVQPQGRVLNPTTFAEHIFPPPGRGAAALQRLRNSGYYERSDPSHRDRANRLHRLYLDMLADSYDSLLSCIRAIDENCMDSNQRQLPIVFEQRYGDPDESPAASAAQAAGGTAASVAGEPGGAAGQSASVSASEVHVDFGGSAESKTARGGSGGDVHVVVLQHGFQGNVFDLRLFRNWMAFLMPTHKYLIAKANEHDTETDLKIMGRRLAQEVDDKLQVWCGGSADRLSSLSFIGHSLGGVIIREALTCDALEPYLSKLHTFISFSSPHLGFLYSEKVHISTGLWLIKRWRKSMALEQLSLTDETDLRNSFMYKLSLVDKLHMFKHVLLVSAHQDKYSPFWSARIELCRQALDDKKNGIVYREMVRNVMGKLQPGQLRRYNVNFFFGKSTLDTVIGRAAHVKFLDDAPLTTQLLLIDVVKSK
eukprot:g4088.t1